MEPDVKEVLTREFAEILEQMAFLFADPVTADELPPLTEPPVRVSMSFTGPFNGSMIMALPEPMCPVVAANLLGIEPEDAADKSKAEDAVKELLNVACGHVLTAIAGTKPVFALSPPVVDSIDTDTWDSLVASENTALVVVEENPVLLHLERSDS
ncbi:MAG: chemotaxis protein CheX [Candidatus Hydrogenedentes bacterium]|nr:chemotaxis protein CheX [Candidatus Hydrogenedentota bacterium]